MIAISDHAWLRISRARPDATAADVQRALSEAEEVDAGVVAALTMSNRRQRRGRALYFRHPAWAGVFVLAATVPKLITFLRFGPEQMRILGAPRTTPEFEPVAEMTLRQLRAIEGDERIKARKLERWQVPTGRLWVVCPSAKVSTSEVFVGRTNTEGWTRIYQMRRRGPGEWLPNRAAAEWWVPGSTHVRRVDWDWSQCARWLLEPAPADAEVCVPYEGES